MGGIVTSKFLIFSESLLVFKQYFMIVVPQPLFPHFNGDTKAAWSPEHGPHAGIGFALILLIACKLKIPHKGA